jgi:hypothetical protein
MAADKEMLIDIHENLRDFVKNVYPPYKAMGFTVYQAYVCAMLHDINKGICDMKHILNELYPPEVEGEI